MIEIKKINDKDILKSFGIKDDNVLAMAMKEKDEIFGVGTFYIKQNFCVIDKIIMNDGFDLFEMKFGLLKSILNLVDLEGIRFAFSDISDERLMKGARFSESLNEEYKDDVTPDKNYNFYLCLDGYFTNHQC